MNSDSEEQNEKIVSGTLAQDNGFLVTLLHNWDIADDFMKIEQSKKTYFWTWKH